MEACSDAGGRVGVVGAAPRQQQRQQQPCGEVRGRGKDEGTDGDGGRGVHEGAGGRQRKRQQPLNAGEVPGAAAVQVNHPRDDPHP